MCFDIDDVFVVIELHIRSSPALLLLDPAKDIEPRLTFLSVQGIKTPELEQKHSMTVERVFCLEVSFPNHVAVFQ